MDDGVHPADPVDLPGDVPRLALVGQVSHDGHRPAVEEITDGFQSLPAAGVDHDLVAAA